MPWKRAKALPPPDNTLFNECFRIQREASEAAGRYIPLIVENVRGAQKWVGREVWNYGSFYLWGDVPALMPFTFGSPKIPNVNNLPRVDGQISPQWRAKSTAHLKNEGGSWFAIGGPGQMVTGQNPDGRKVSGDWFGSYADMKAAGTISPGRLHGKNSVKRKASSAMIAKIPFPLAQHIARTFKPVET